MIKDKLGRELVPGQWVAKATGNRYCPMEIRRVERIEGDKVYLNGAKGSYLHYPNQIVIIAQSNDPLALILESKYK